MTIFNMGETKIINWRTLSDISFEPNTQKEFWRWRDDTKADFSLNCRTLLKALRTEVYKMLKFAEYKDGEENLLMKFFEIYENPKYEQKKKEVLTAYGLRDIDESV